MATLTLKCINGIFESNTEFELKGLDDQSTVAALKSLIAEESPLVGPLNLKYGANLRDLNGVAGKTTLRKLGIKDGDYVVYEPVNADAARSKRALKEPEEEVAPSAPSLSRQLSEPYAYDLEGADYAEVVGEITLEGWETVAKGDDDLPGAAPPSFKRQTSWQVIGNSEINSMQKAMADECAEIMHVTVDEAAAMLRSYDWKQHDLLLDWTTTPDKVRDKAGIKGTKKELTPAPAPSSEEDTFECLLCTETIPFKDTFALDCGHRLCNDCWKGWLDAAFDKGAECVFTQCAIHKCGQFVPINFFQKMVGKEKAQKIDEYLTTAFVRSNAYLKWCPKPGCDRAVEYRGKGMKTVVCQCGYMFCFACGQECHDPAPCEVVAQWNAKNSAESSIFAWIEKNKNEQDVKNCTKCKVVIEKNQGCKHMTCKNCKHEFCWLCYQNWNGHNEQICTDFQKTNLAKDREKRENEGDESGDEFRRYQFYFTRFDNHGKSIKFAQRIREEAVERMDKLQDIGGEGKQRVQFLLDAVGEIIDCRRLLQWSYPWCFLMKEDSNLYRLFKGHQEALEKFTEELHELTEKPINGLFEGDTRIQIINKTRVLRTYRKNIVEFAKLNH